MMELRNKIKHHFHEALKAKNSDHEVALGFAIGTFLEIFFLVPGLGLLISILVLLMYSRLSKYALLFALLFWNILFIAPLYILSYHVGNLIFDVYPSVDFDAGFSSNVLLLSRRFLIGHLIVSSVFSIFIYFIAKWIIKTYRKRLN